MNQIAIFLSMGEHGIGFLSFPCTPQIYDILSFIKRDTVAPVSPELPEIHDVVKAMILKPLPDEIPDDISNAIAELETMPQVWDYFNKNVAINSEGTLLTFRLTPKQALCSEWIKARYGRLNGSTGDKIYRVNIN